ncbi:uncharacterized protein LOC114363122 [Ostrinia furnacalis]|uniref:uncharacterized protein LOC114363122 n=1 Tax=Ostrinia furnacalis TaxID=93504 RepID=UPI00103C30BD|nr:uncharacterized protein LOC114363122 [Ostrinia furnacalis]
MAAATCLCAGLLALAVVVSPEIRSSLVLNKLVKVKPVGGNLAKAFVPLTEIPPPHLPLASGRRHFEDCSQKPPAKEVYGGAKVDIFGEYYDDMVAKTVATVIFPDHIDRKHFEVTTEVPYLTVGPIEAIGYHPSTLKSDHPAECEKIYQDHLAEMYSDETTDYSEESLEMARMPLSPTAKPSKSDEFNLEDLYEDFER